MDLLLTSAQNCYIALGLRPYENSLHRLVLGRGKKHGLFDAIPFTEQYIYEELVFAVNLAREAEGTNGFMENVVRLTKVDCGLSGTVSAANVQGAMINVGFEVAEVVLEQADLSPGKDSSWFVSFANKRLDEYEPLFRASYSSTEPVPERALRIGFEPRDHPLLAYLGSVSDHFADALQIDRRYPMLQELLLATYTTFLQSLGNLNDAT